MKKKLLAILPILCVLLCVLALGASAETTVTEIDTADEITDMSGNYKLTADITVTAPIGTSAAPFKGTFDGGGHTVTVKIDTADSGVGLFGHVGGGATIKNLTVNGSVSSTGNNVGGIIGFAEIDNASAVTIENCKNYASVKGNAGVGGIVGRFRLNHKDIEGAHRIVGCANYGNVSGTGTNGMVGGIVGILTNGNGGTMATMSVENCYNKGAIDAESMYVGGIVGYFRNYTEKKNTLTNCMNSGTISGNSYVGGIVGYVVQKPQTITDCYNGGSVTADSGSADAIAIIAANATGSTIEDTYYLQESGTSSIGTQVTTENYGDAATFVGFSSNYWTFAGDGPMLETFFELDEIIGSKEELLLLMNSTDAAAWGDDKKYTLACDIDLESCEGQNPIGNAKTPFTGSFDGNGKTISGLNITGAAAGTGLFGVVSGNVTIKNLTVDGTVTSKADAVGGIVGRFKTADNASLVINNCTNNCTVSTTTRYIGGILGYVEGSSENVTLKISDCVNNGGISATGNVAGGILGYYNNNNNTASNDPDTVTVTKCKNTGAIDANQYVGGIVGALLGTQNRYYADIKLTELYNNNGEQIIIRSGSDYCGTIIGCIRSLKGGSYTISDLHDRAEPVNTDEEGYIIYTSGETTYYFDGDKYYTKGAEGYTEADLTETEINNLVYGWSNGCAPIGRIDGFTANNKLEVTRVVAEMALAISSSSTAVIDVTYFAHGYADNNDSSRPYDYTDVIFDDRAANPKDNKWVMTWSGPMLKAFAENKISGIKYETVSEKADDGKTYDNNSAQLTISTAEDLIKFMNCHRLWDLDITLGEDIDLSDYETSAKQYYKGYTEGYAENGDLNELKQMPIGRPLEKKFSGTFDGAGYTISGLNITYNENYGSGLFGTVEGRTVDDARIPVVIKNLTVEGKVETTGGRVGGIVGHVLAPLEISDCKSYVNVTALNAAAGGIIGVYATSNGSYVNVTNCTNHGDINGKAYLGGIVGYFVRASEASDKLTITNCTNNGAITGTSVGCGGIFGTAAISCSGDPDDVSSVTITDCANNGTVNCKQASGGIFGLIQKHSAATPTGATYTIENCTNNAGATITTTAGRGGAAGIIGLVTLYTDNILTVKGCENRADIDGYGRSGGIVGHIFNDSKEVVEEDAESGGNDGVTEDSDNTEEGSTEGEGNGGVTEDSDDNDAGSTETTQNEVYNARYIITECNNYGNVTISGQNVAGGIVGFYNNQAIVPNGKTRNNLYIANCYNEGEISTGEKQYVGGIVGALGGGSNGIVYSDVVIDTVYNEGDVSATAYTASVFGCLRPLAGNGTYTIKNVHGGKAAKPLIGVFGKGSAAHYELTNAYAEYYNDFVGTYNSSTITLANSATDANNIFQLQTFVENSGEAWVMTANGPMLKYFAKDTIDAYKEYTVSSAADLIKLMNTPALWGATVILEEDINLTNVTGQAPIGNSHIGFMGTFDGGRHTISGLNLTGAENVGLFGYVEGYDKGDSYVGAAISNLTVNGSVTGNSPSNNTTTLGTGGIIGKANGVKLTNCVNNVTVNGNNCVGGVIGLINVGGLDIYPLTDENETTYKAKLTYNAGTTLIENCKNEAAVVATGLRVGGIAGYVYGINKDAVATFTNNENSGNVSADSYAGGFAGRFGNSASGANNVYTIEKFKNTGNITVENGYAGGLAGILSLGSGTSAHGATVTVDTVLNGSNLRDINTEEGTITSTGEKGRYVGGIVGFSRNCDSNEKALQYSNLMNTGKVYGACTTAEGGAVGGIFGAANDGSGLYTAENLYNRGEVTTATNSVFGAITAPTGFGNAYNNGYVDDLYAYGTEDNTVNYVNFVSADMLGYSEAFTQTPSDSDYLKAYKNGLAPFEIAYTTSETLGSTYNDWIMTSEGAELSYYHVHDSVENGVVKCICISEEKTTLSFRVTLLSEYVLEYIAPYVASETNPRMVFTSTDASGNITTTIVEPVTYATSGANNEEDFKAMYKDSGESRYYFKVPGIAGKEMADTITGTFYYGEGADMIKSNTVSGNLIAYYKAAKGAWGTRPDDVSIKLMTLLNAMVNYGAAAQEYFEYNTTNLATRLAGAEEVDYTTTDVTINENEVKVINTPVDGQTFFFSKQAANLDQRISTVLYFTYEGDAPDLANLTFKGSYINVTGALVTFRVEGSDMELKKLDEKNVVAVYVDRPAAKDLRVEFTGALYSAGNQVSDKVTTSFECYAQKVVNDSNLAASLEIDETKATNLKALCRSILAYSDAAKDYFEVYWIDALKDAGNT